MSERVTHVMFGGNLRMAADLAPGIFTATL